MAGTAGERMAGTEVECRGCTADKGAGCMAGTAGGCMAGTAGGCMADRAGGRRADRAEGRMVGRAAGAGCMRGKEEAGAGCMAGTEAGCMGRGRMVPLASGRPQGRRSRSFRSTDRTRIDRRTQSDIRPVDSLTSPVRSCRTAGLPSDSLGHSSLVVVRSSSDRSRSSPSRSPLVRGFRGRSSRPW